MRSLRRLSTAVPSDGAPPCISPPTPFAQRAWSARLRAAERAAILRLARARVDF